MAYYLPPPDSYISSSTSNGFAAGPHDPSYFNAPTLPHQDMQRKRPKYTRSKTGCLTCRVKKIKCDETKPECIRCAHGQRECTWPETAAPPRKKQPSSRRHSEAFDDRATASSVSDESSPSLRALTPPHRLEPESALLPPRRNTEPNVLQLPPVMAPEAEYRRASLPRPQFGQQSYQQQHTTSTSTTTTQAHNHSHSMGGIPSDQMNYARYDGTYGHHSRQPMDQSSAPRGLAMATGFRGASHQQAMHQWPTSSTMMSPIESYAQYPIQQERGMVGAVNGMHYRYQ